MTNSLREDGWTRLLKVLVLIMVLTPWSCQDDSEPRTDSQTHWIQVCESNDECGQLACVCGLCTLDCTTATSVCDDTPASSSCSPEDSGAVDIVCGGVAPVSMCLPSCDTTRCAVGTSCRDGFCVPDEVLAVANDTGDDVGPDAACDDVSRPSPTICGDEQALEPVRDDAGCIVDWECVDPECELIDPGCRDDQIVRRVEDSAGCFTLFCLDGGQFSCGTLLCDLATDYCEEMIPGVPGPSSFACQPLPMACEPGPWCSCLIETVGGPEWSCSENDEGGLQMTIALP